MNLLAAKNVFYECREVFSCPAAQQCIKWASSLSQLKYIRVSSLHSPSTCSNLVPPVSLSSERLLLAVLKVTGWECRAELYSSAARACGVLLTS